MMSYIGMCIIWKLNKPIYNILCKCTVDENFAFENIRIKYKLLYSDLLIFQIIYWYNQFSIQY